MTDYLIGAGAACLIGLVLGIIADSDVREAVIKAVWTLVIAPFYVACLVVGLLWKRIPGSGRVTWFRGRRLSTQALARFARRVEYQTEPDGAWVVTWRRGAFVVLRAPTPSGGTAPTPQET